MYRTKIVVFAMLLTVVCSPLAASAQYLKLDPPPDADKPTPGSDASCWLATAANMLAGAGYGNGANVQTRADEIYDQLKTHFEALYTGR